MADYTQRVVKTVRKEYVLRTPTNWAEVNKVLHAISKDLEGQNAADNTVTVDACQEPIVFSFEVSSEVTDV